MCICVHRITAPDLWIHGCFSLSTHSQISIHSVRESRNILHCCRKSSGRALLAGKITTESLSLSLSWITSQVHQVSWPVHLFPVYKSESAFKELVCMGGGWGNVTYRITVVYIGHSSWATEWKCVLVGGDVTSPSDQNMQIMLLCSRAIVNFICHCQYMNPLEGLKACSRIMTPARQCIMLLPVCMCALNLD